MNKLNVKRCTLTTVLSLVFLLPQLPAQLHAAENAPSNFPLDLFDVADSNSNQNAGGGITLNNPSDSQGNPGQNKGGQRSNIGSNVSTGGTGSIGGQSRPGGGGFAPRPQSQNNGSNNGSNNSSNNNNSNNGNNNGTNTGRPTMKAVTVSEAFSCPLFENRPHAELIQAINDLTREVQINQECNQDTSAKALQSNGKVLQDNLAALQKMMGAAAGAEVDVNQLNTLMASTTNAVSTMGGIINNNSFLNSKCGRESMSTGKALLAFNDIIDGLAPFALFAVSMNAALAPALPFVIGGAITTAGISAVSKMIQNNTIDMTIPAHRRAILQNTCQFTKVAKKVRFMQLAQSGKIEKITQELERDIPLYKAKLTNPSQELLELITMRRSRVALMTEINQQLSKDTIFFDKLATNFQKLNNNDSSVGGIKNANSDFSVCNYAKTTILVLANQKLSKEVQFPDSVFHNYIKAAAGDVEATINSEAATKSNEAYQKQIISINLDKARSTELRECVGFVGGWLGNLRTVIEDTNNSLLRMQDDLEDVLNANPEYRNAKAANDKYQEQQTTIKRVKYAMEELAKENSVIDRSELAQSINVLKAGLFGSFSDWSFGVPPVLAWINHTKSMHDQALAAFNLAMKTVRDNSWNITESGNPATRKLVAAPYGGVQVDQQKYQRDQKIAAKLGNLSSENKELMNDPLTHKAVCDNLETAWLEWNAAIDHLGAIQFFCDMIDPVIDVKVDTGVVKACRGNLELNKMTGPVSLVQSAKTNLAARGYREKALQVSKIMKDLECQMPGISVMNE